MVYHCSTYVARAHAFAQLTPFYTHTPFDVLVAGCRFGLPVLFLVPYWFFAVAFCCVLRAHVTPRLLRRLCPVCTLRATRTLRLRCAWRLPAVCGARRICCAAPLSPHICTSTTLTHRALISRPFRLTAVLHAPSWRPRFMDRTFVRSFCDGEHRGGGGMLPLFHKSFRARVKRRTAHSAPLTAHRTRAYKRTFEHILPLSRIFLFKKNFSCCTQTPSHRVVCNALVT